jgi:acyl-coenzyme A synthetase/AMP-(fatty) acid ligase
MTRLPFTQAESIGILAERAADRLPDGTVNVGTPSSLLGPGPVATYSELASVVRELSGWFPAAGVAPGDRVVIAKRNHFDILLLAAAAARAGAIPALLSPSILPDQARVMLDRIAPSTVLVDRDALHGWALDGRDPWRLVVLDGPRGASNGDLPAGSVPADDLRGAPPPPARPQAFTDPMVVTHTSGTTGVPKLVVHSAETNSGRARTQTMRIPVVSIGRNDRYAACLAWMHARAVDGYAAFLHVGCPLLALAETSVDAAAPLLAGFEPTIVEAIPNVFLLWEDMATTSPAAFAHTRMFLTAFDSIHPRTVRALLGASGTRFPLWLQAYGQSEVGGVSVDLYTRRTVRDRPDRPPTLRHIGWTPPTMGRMRVIDTATGRRARPGRVGQFQVRSKTLALTYLGQEDLHTRRSRDGWWTMGDVGLKTRSGRAILHDRDIDRCDGVDSCLELEDLLLDSLPELTEIVVVDVAGSATPVVATRGDLPLDRAAWAAAVGRTTARLAEPIRLAWDDIPRTATLKVRRWLLVDQLGTRPDTPEPAVSTATP